jgi:signal transduction histidine kinase
MGRSLLDVIELRKTALYCLVWTSIFSVFLGLIAAWFFARRVHKRVQSLSNALSGVAAGNLNARLPVTCAYDDIDDIAVKVNDTLDRLKQTVDGMRQVSTDIAHDLKTPLNRLFISLDDAARKSRRGECVGDDLDAALEETQGINSTFEALLRIAQIEAGARKSEFKHFDLAQVLSTAAEVYAPVVEESCNNLTVNIPSEKSLPMLGDKDLMLQLIVNLIENAVHHCSEYSDIVINAGREAEVIWFNVEDSGPGIPDEEREKVFQRLYRLERSRTTRGTGLGLSMVKAISDLHCGSISLEDNKPGLRFGIRFDRNCPLDS